MHKSLPFLVKDEGRRVAEANLEQVKRTRLITKLMNNATACSDKNTYKLSFEYTYLIREPKDRLPKNRTNLFSDNLIIDYDSLLIKHHS